MDEELLRFLGTGLGAVVEDPGLGERFQVDEPWDSESDPLSQASSSVQSVEA